MKRHYIIGFSLLFAFFMFIAAGSAGPNTEVVIGSIGFFGIVALLPLFLYLVIVDVRTQKESIPAQSADGETQEVPSAVSETQPAASKVVYTGLPGPFKKKEPMRENEIDRSFIEKLRSEQVDIRGEGGLGSVQDRSEESEERSRKGLLDIPDRIQDKPEEKTEKQAEKLKPNEEKKSRGRDEPEDGKKG